MRLTKHKLFNVIIFLFHLRFYMPHTYPYRRKTDKIFDGNLRKNFQISLQKTYVYVMGTH